MKNINYFKTKNKYESIFFYRFIKLFLLIAAVVIVFTSIITVSAGAINQVQQPMRVIVFAKELTEKHEYQINTYIPRMCKNKKHNIEYQYFDINNLSEEGEKYRKKYYKIKKLETKNIEKHRIILIFEWGNTYAYYYATGVALIMGFEKLRYRHFGV